MYVCDVRTRLAHQGLLFFSGDTSCVKNKKHFKFYIQCNNKQNGICLQVTFLHVLKESIRVVVRGDVVTSQCPNWHTPIWLSNHGMMRACFLVLTRSHTKSILDSYHSTLLLVHLSKGTPKQYY